MPSSSPRRFSTLNLPRIVLWVASVAIAVIGYFSMITANASEAATYAAGTADYPALFAAQSASTVGGMLIVVGVLGLLLALTSLAITRRPAVAADPIVPDETIDPLFDETNTDETNTDATNTDETSIDAPVAEDAPAH